MAGTDQVSDFVTADIDQRARRASVLGGAPAPRLNIPSVMDAAETQGGGHVRAKAVGPSKEPSPIGAAWGCA